MSEQDEQNFDPQPTHTTRNLPAQLESQRLLRRIAEEQASQTAAATEAACRRGAAAAGGGGGGFEPADSWEERERAARLAELASESAALAARQAALREAAADLERCAGGAPQCICLFSVLFVAACQVNQCQARVTE